MYYYNEPYMTEEMWRKGAFLLSSLFPQLRRLSRVADVIVMYKNIISVFVRKSFMLLFQIIMRKYMKIIN